MMELQQFNDIKNNLYAVMKLCSTLAVEIQMLHEKHEKQMKALIRLGDGLGIDVTQEVE